MKLMVTTEDRFVQPDNGQIHSVSGYDYAFWQRYLEVFDEVIIFARLLRVDAVPSDTVSAAGPGVSFYPIPFYVGPWQYVIMRGKIAALARAAVDKADAFNLRVPGTLSNQLWRQLRKRNIPYGIEVVGDPWDALAPGSVKSIIRPVLRSKFKRDMTLQCKYAAAASYVTRSGLQKRYPPGCWSTHYSSIDLPPEAIISADQLDVRIKRLRTKSPTRPWVIVHVGMLEHFYKAPDVLLRALAICQHKDRRLRLQIIGDGRRRKELEDLARRLNVTDDVEFLGKVETKDKLFDLLDQADLFVLPSRQEGLPRAVIEAMARGLPCIGSTVGGIPELLAGDDLVPPNDVQALNSKIEAVITDITRMEHMARRNHQKASEFTFDILKLRRKEYYTRLREVYASPHKRDSK